MKYCQGTSCHEYKTKDRIRGTKGNKSYQTRRRSSFYYGKGNFCCQTCLYDWINKHIEQALNHFGRTTEPKKTMCDQAWYKDYSRSYDGNINGHSTFSHYFVNDLLGQRIPITEQQYDDTNIITPNNLSQ
jgi:hypothetical protein|tara:strand:- start:14 stop:403 length:390 start_codon:yes stop_codon:yes gene_type:complete